MNAGAAGPGLVVIRPGWATFDGPLTGRVDSARFRGPHTDYAISTEAGQVMVRTLGSPRLPEGQAVSWGLHRAWVVEPTT